MRFALVPVLLLTACARDRNGGVYDTAYDTTCDLEVVVEAASCGGIAQGVAWEITDASGESYLSATSSGEWAPQSPGTSIYGTIEGGAFSVYAEYYFLDGSAEVVTGSGYCPEGAAAAFLFQCA